MRKVRRFSLITLTAVILGGVMWGVLRPREPLYAGKPLHFWIEILDSVSPGMDPPQDWTELGDDEIPVLVKALEIRDSRWHNIYPRVHQAIWRRLPVSLLRHLPRPMNTEDIAINALLWLYPLNDMYATNAAAFRPAIPTLIHLLKTDKSGPIRMMAATELGFIGAGNESVTAALAGARGDQSMSVRNNAAEALRRIDLEAAHRADAEQNNRRANALDSKVAGK
jgi:hypothetical protein